MYYTDRRLPTIWVLGIPVSRLTADEAVESVARLAVEPTPRSISYVNAHTLNLAYGDRQLQRALSRSSLVLNDGLGVQLAARMRRDSFPENLNGSDFTVRLLKLAAERSWSVFLLGSEPGVAEAAAQKLSNRIQGLRIVGTCHGFTPDRDDELAERIRAAETQMLIVAFGSPRQEVWLDHNLAATGASIGVGVGAFLDFSAGRVSRAPKWMNGLGIEWCFRLAREPKRLWRRYIVGNPVFLFRAWHTRHTDAREGFRSPASPDADQVAAAARPPAD